MQRAGDIVTHARRIAPRRLTRGSWHAALALSILAAVPARAETLAVVAPGAAACVLRAAPEGTAAAEIAALEAAAETLGGRARRLLADAATMRLAPAREGVPGFGDWAYGWVQSYVTSYRILARGVASLSGSVANGGETPLAARLAEEMAEPIRAEFRARVLAPALGGAAFVSDLAHVGAVLDDGWQAALAASAARLARLPPATAGAVAVRRIDLAAAAAPMAPALRAATPADPAALIAEDGTDGGAAFLRALRPMAARLGAVLVRLSEFGSAVAAGGVFGFAVGGMTGSAAGVAGGIGVAWGIDWLFNRLDAGLNRTAFEAQALDAIARAERRLAEDASRAATAALAARLGAVAGEGGCR
ncbi:hypothetical protein [Roseomonas sp. HF4]|uniref:hypothetical protein n=1 Tax=Roseomonas sp. HF4 TaxID=2562313 RepID=UPI0010C07B00|nr:hypothetical protein [Roseomonas sp. HF4]